MVLTIQQGDYTVDLRYVSNIKFDFKHEFKSAEVTFSENPHDEDFKEGVEDTYTFEEEDYDSLMAYLASR
jgi:hypothetical protein